MKYTREQLMAMDREVVRKMADNVYDVNTILNSGSKPIVSGNLWVSDIIRLSERLIWAGTVMYVSHKLAKVADRLIDVVDPNTTANS